MVDFSKYEAGRRNINDDYAAKRVASDFGRFTSQRRGSRQLGDYRQNFRNSHQGFMGSHARRGTTMGGQVSSGAFGQALNRRAADFTRDTGRMQQDMDFENQRYDQENAQIDNWRRQAIQDLEYQKQREIALTALGIQGIRPLIGGR